MKRVAYFLWLLTLMAGCVLEDKPVDPGFDGGVEAGMCVVCPPSKPVCNDALECVECMADDADYCTEQALLCHIESSTCVACLGDSNCSTAGAARCDANECKPCDDGVQCTNIDGLPGDDNACDNGVCVDCTPETEASTCPNNRSCNPATRQCTNTEVGSLETCEECVSDSECGEGGSPSEAHRCVEMFFEGGRYPDGEKGFCLKTTAGGCEQPYSITLSMRPSLSGSPRANYCGINEQLATCPAVKALVDNQQCPSGDPLECPQPSGLCKQVGDLQNRCTYPCSDVVECKDAPVPGSTCGPGSGINDYCGG